MKKTNTIRNRIWVLLFYVVLIGFWQLIYYLGANVFGWWKPYAFPNPQGVAHSFIGLMEEGKLVIAILYSFKRCLMGFAISVVIGVILGMFISFFPKAGNAVKPLISGIQSLPSVCWVPFAILWFGLKESSILFVVVMGSICSVIVAIDSSFKSVPPMYIKVARTLGADNVSLYRYVLLPAILPMVVSGLRQAWSFAWRALMSAEVMAATIGLGFSLQSGRDMADINQVGMVMIVIILLGIAVDKFVFSTIENKLLRKRGMLV